MNIFPLFFAAAEIGIGRGPFYFATTKIRIGRGALLRLVVCGRDRCHSGGFLLRIMPPSWHPVPACIPRQCCRRANPILATTAAGGLFFDAATKIGIGRGKRCRNDRSRRNHSPLPLRRLESDAERYGGRDGCSRRNHSPLHRFPSLGLKSRIDARKMV